MPLEYFPWHVQGRNFVTPYPYPVIGKAYGCLTDDVIDIVFRDGRVRIGNTLLPDDIREKVAKGDTEWDGYTLKFE